MSARRGPILATTQQARRLGRSTATVERAPLSGSRTLDWGRAWLGKMIPIYFGQLTSALTARAGGTPGSGTARLYSVTGSALDLDGEEFPVKNFWKASFGTGKDCVLVGLGDAVWAFVIEC